MTSLTPRYGSANGGTLLTMQGQRFPSAAGSINIFLDGQQCTSVTVVSSTQITCVTAPAKASKSEVIFINFYLIRNPNLN